MVKSVSKKTLNSKKMIQKGGADLICPSDISSAAADEIIKLISNVFNASPLDKPTFDGLVAGKDYSAETKTYSFALLDTVKGDATSTNYAFKANFVARLTGDLTATQLLEALKATADELFAATATAAPAEEVKKPVIEGDATTPNPKVEGVQMIPEGNPGGRKYSRLLGGASKKTSKKTSKKVAVKKSSKKATSKKSSKKMTGGASKKTSKKTSKKAAVKKTSKKSSKK